MAIFDAVKFFDDHRVYWTTSGSKHNTRGWINTPCPFCGFNQHANHLGFQLATGAFKCWKCGKKSQLDVISKLLRCNLQEARDIRKRYVSQDGAQRTLPKQHRAKDAVKIQKSSRCVFPPGTVPLPTRHREYLSLRRFNADYLISEWGLRGVEGVGRYKWRIIAPIMFKGRMVSYQGRDITDRSPMKYKACRKEDEVIDHQHVIYGMDKCRGRTCILVEGITDVWRLGPGAVCCFGTAYTMHQINLLAERFDKVYILFDSDDENAQKMADEIGLLLSARGLEIEALELEEGLDPGAMPQEEADKLMIELGFKEAA